MASRKTAGQQKMRRKSFDYSLFVIVLLLVVFGLVMLYSTSSYNGMVKFADPAYYLKKQAFATGLGLVAMVIVSRMDYRVWERYTYLAYGVSLVLSTAVLFFGDEYNGSKRWLALGPLSFQPSEFAKLAVILLLAHGVTKRVKKMGSIWQMFPVIHYYSGHCGDSHFYCKSQIFTVYQHGASRRHFHRHFSERGILPPGTACHLAESRGL